MNKESPRMVRLIRSAVSRPTTEVDDITRSVQYYCRCRHSLVEGAKKAAGRGEGRI